MAVSCYSLRTDSEIEFISNFARYGSTSGANAGCLRSLAKWAKASGNSASTLAMQNRLETFLSSSPCRRLLVEEQAQFGDEADIRKRDVIAHNELAIGRSTPD